MADWLASGGASAGAGLHEFVLSSDDPDDLTLRQARLLGMADVVAHEPGVARQVLVRARADAVRLAIAPGDAAPLREGLIVVLRAPCS